ncbi:hypothetical protein BDN72DRAFT_735566, partial [Pluteus cervinus]
SFQLDLPSRLKQRGIHDSFHSSLLRIHVPNDDRLFPGRLDSQIGDFEDKEYEWSVDRITNHLGTKTDASFEVKWRSGDVTWLAYDKVLDMNILPAYFDTLG